MSTMALPQHVKLTSYIGAKLVGGICCPWHFLCIYVPCSSQR